MAYDLPPLTKHGKNRSELNRQLAPTQRTSESSSCMCDSNDFFPFLFWFHFLHCLQNRAADRIGLFLCVVVWNPSLSLFFLCWIVSDFNRFQLQSFWWWIFFLDHHFLIPSNNNLQKTFDLALTCIQSTVLYNGNRKCHANTAKLRELVHTIQIREHNSISFYNLNW